MHVRNHIVRLWRRRLPFVGALASRLGVRLKVKGLHGASLLRHFHRLPQPYSKGEFMLNFSRFSIRPLADSLATEVALAPARFGAAWRVAPVLCFSKARQLSVRRAAIFALAAAALAVAADPALAQATGGGGDITTFLQNLVNMVTGTAGKLIAVLAICIVGIGALMGALSLRAAGGVILGVLLIFSSAWIVDQIVA